jgi:hypothetical protein
MGRKILTDLISAGDKLARLTRGSDRKLKYGLVFVAAAILALAAIEGWDWAKETRARSFASGGEAGIAEAIADVDACLYGDHAGYSFSACMAQRPTVGRLWAPAHPTELFDKPARP